MTPANPTAAGTLPKRRQVLHVATTSGAVTVLADHGVTPTDLTLVAELLKRSAEGPFQFRAQINGIEVTGTDAEAMAQLAAKHSPLKTEVTP